MDTKLTGKTRIESDLIGAREIPAEALYGVQTLRGIENFSISKFRLSEYPLFIKQYFKKRNFDIKMIEGD